MMGGHHAVTGAAAWMAVAGSAQIAGHATGAGVLGLGPGEVLAGAVVATGAALLPDIDHPSATISRSAGHLSHLLTSAVGLAAGHRGATHTPLGIVMFTAIAALVAATDLRVVLPLAGEVHVGAAVLVAVMTAFGVQALEMVEGRLLPWAVGIGAGVVAAVMAPDATIWLPLAVGIGCLAHVAGDLLTTRGIPFPLWPIVIRPGRLKNPLWLRGGNIALPLLGDAGSRREWALCTVVTAYALLAVAATAWTIIRG